MDSTIKKAQKTRKRKTKNGNSHLGAIAEKYGKDYGVRIEDDLNQYLQKNGFSSLSVLLKNDHQ